MELRLGIVSFLLILQFSAAVSQEKKKRINITLQSDNVMEGELFYLHNSETLFVVDSAFFKDSKVSFSITCGNTKYDPLPLRISDSKRDFIQNIWVEGKDINIIVKDGQPTVTGSEINREMAVYSRVIATLEDQRDLCIVSRNTRCVDSLENLIKRRLVPFVNQQTSYLGLLMLFQHTKGENISIEDAKRYFSTYEVSLKNSKIGRKMQLLLDNYVVFRPGDSLINFSARDAGGKSVSVHAIKKKYVLIDFWASWCGPCIREFDALKALYKSYASDLEIIGVSSDNSMARYEKALALYQLPWPNVCDCEGTLGILSIKYKITAVPTRFLAKDNKIIAVNPSLEEVESFLKTHLDQDEE